MSLMIKMHKFVIRIILYITVYQLLKEVCMFCTVYWMYSNKPIVQYVPLKHQFT